jgi:hypothetical protein
MTNRARHRRPGEADGFLAQSHDDRLAALQRPVIDVLGADVRRLVALRRPVTDVVGADVRLLVALRRITRQIRAVKIALAAGLELKKRPRPRPPLTGVLVPYEEVRWQYAGVVADWKERLPPRARTARTAREAAADALRAALRAAFDDMMTDEEVIGLRDSETKVSSKRSEKAWSQIRATALGAYVGRHLLPVIGASAVRARVARERTFRDRWESFLLWIDAEHPALLSDMIGVALMLEQHRRDYFRRGRQPHAGFYALCGPVYLVIVRAMHEEEHPGHI